MIKEFLDGWYTHKNGGRIDPPDYEITPIWPRWLCAFWTQHAREVRWIDSRNAEVGRRCRCGAAFVIHE